MREPGESGQCQIVPCGMNPSTRRNVEGDETRLKCGTTQAKEGCEYLSKESGFYSAGSNGGGWGKGMVLNVSDQRSDIIRAVLLGKRIGKLEIENRLVKACAQVRN